MAESPEVQRARRILQTNPHSAARDEARAVLEGENPNLSQAQFLRPSERDRLERAE